VFYFSGTGNTLSIAREISQKIEAELVCISEVVKTQRKYFCASKAVIVFPSYLAPLSGLPLVVEKFVKSIDNIGDITFFAVCNCGGYESVNAFPSLHKLRQIIQSCGGKLYAEYYLRMPMNNLDYDHIPIPINRNQEDIIRISKLKIDQICSYIMNNKKTRHKVGKDLFFLIMNPIYKLMRPAIMKELKARAYEPADSGLQYYELIPLTDKSIGVDEKCNGCGICARVCPVGNIIIKNEKPEFQHRCEMCFACDEWCPTDSIHHWSRENGVKYHHPEVSVANLLNKQIEMAVTDTKFEKRCHERNPTPKR
jgi:ferredoxin/flavodoxin